MKNNDNEATVFEGFDNNENSSKNVEEEKTVLDTTSDKTVIDEGNTELDDKTVISENSTIDDYDATKIDDEATFLDEVDDGEIDENKTQFKGFNEDAKFVDNTSGLTEDGDKTHFRGFNKSATYEDGLNSDSTIPLQAKTKNLKNISLPVGYEFNFKYVIKKVLGQGNFGYTYLAVEKVTGKKVAIKEFFPQGFVGRNSDHSISLKFNISPKEKEQFRRCIELFNEEAQNLNEATTKEKSKNVVNLVSFEENINNTKYYLMDYEEGEDLQSYLKDKKDLSQKEILKIIEPILDGLNHIHKYGVLHKDIKPENIFRKKNNDLMLIDFGSSVQGANFYTPTYAAVEQYKRLMKEYGPYTDLYAIGVMLYELVKGEKPPKSSDRERAITSGKRDPYKLISKDSSLPKGKFNKYFLEAIDWALKYSYEERPQSASEFLHHLSGGKQRQKKLVWTVSIIAILVFIAGAVISQIKPKGNLSIDIASLEGVEIQIDGKTKKHTQGLKHELVVGKHKVNFYKNGYLPIEREIIIKEKKDSTIRNIEFIPKKLVVSFKTLKGISPTIEVIYPNGEVKTIGNGNFEYTIEYTTKPLTFRATKEKHDSQEVTVNYEDLIKNQIVVFDKVKLQEGVVHFKTDPEGAEVEIDRTLVVHENNNKPKLTNFSKRMPIGNYTISYYKPGFKKVEHKVSLEKDKIVADEIVLEKIKTLGGTSKTVFLKEPLIPTMVKFRKNLSIADSEITYDMIVRFLNSKKFNQETLHKYFFVYVNSISRYIKSQEDGFVAIKQYENYPIVNISWYGANEYAKWLSKETGRKFRLPKGSEWEYVARKVGNKSDMITRYSYNSIKASKPGKIDDKQIFDIYGNVMEWCSDSIGEFSKEVRGGSWKTDMSKFKPYISNFINANNTKFNDLGFRIVEEH